MSQCLQPMITIIEDTFGTNYKKEKTNVPRRTRLESNKTGDWTSKKRP